MVHNAYGYGLFTGGLGFHYGAEKLGCTVVPMSGGKTPRQVLLLQDLGGEVLCCTPSYALNIAQTMPRAGVGPASSTLELGIFGAEPWTEAMRAEIERQLGIAALDIYGLSEIIGPGVSSECIEAARRAAHLQEDHFLVEVIDPETASRCPTAQEGELVFTTLTEGGAADAALPHRRHRVADPRPCACGRTHGAHEPGARPHRRHAGHPRREPVPVEVERVAARGRGRRAALPARRCARPQALDVLTVEIEAASDDLDHEVLAAAAARRLDRALGLACDVRVLDEGQVPRSDGKALRVVDERES